MLLAAWDRWRESLLARPLQSVTRAKVTDPRAMRQEPDVVRRDGYGREDGELQSRVCAVAAPVRIGGDAVAARSVSGARLDLATATSQVVPLADELSANLSDGSTPRRVACAAGDLIPAGIR